MGVPFGLHVTPHQQHKPFGSTEPLHRMVSANAMKPSSGKSLNKSCCNGALLRQSARSHSIVFGSFDEILYDGGSGSSRYCKVYPRYFGETGLNHGNTSTPWPGYCSIGAPEAVLVRRKLKAYHQLRSDFADFFVCQPYTFYKKGVQFFVQEMVACH
ncbi:hypothetical protein KIN20_037530 [Parelaphostrongylus tenuis]|uniref:Uncharacterized protein n=1 Tax=Parelaphostrongylus tenuis TaxID=148309 RepID=A0AAD5WMJ6_PARTN|nr:hypothetical protein KIN20_037530 [Parelaphostrongylus tenuis]